MKEDDLTSDVLTSDVRPVLCPQVGIAGCPGTCARLCSLYSGGDQFMLVQSKPWLCEGALAR